jgi:lipoprotein-anchoring transpeptidase ErfK/SrfK
MPIGLQPGLTLSSKAFRPRPSRQKKSKLLSALAPFLLAFAFLTCGPIIKMVKANPFYDGSTALLAANPGQTLQRLDHGFTRGKLVRYASHFDPGTVIVDTKSNQLYYVLSQAAAVTYKVATAKPGFEWKGQHRVSMKTQWPDWRPPEEMRQRKPELPEFMQGGPENPLGARAIYLGASIYRIHGTNEPKSIGKHASSGCIRMLNADVSELYQFIKRGTLVVVM